MRKLIPRLAAIAFLSLAPAAAMAVVPSTADANHCWKCHRDWLGQYYCEQDGGEGWSAECVVTGGGSFCYTIGACID